MFQNQKSEQRDAWLSLSQPGQRFHPRGFSCCAAQKMCFSMMCELNVQGASVLIRRRCSETASSTNVKKFFLYFGLSLQSGCVALHVCSAAPVHIAVGGYRGIKGWLSNFLPCMFKPVTFDLSPGLNKTEKMNPTGTFQRGIQATSPNNCSHTQWRLNRHVLFQISAKQRRKRSSTLARGVARYFCTLLPSSGETCTVQMVCHNIQLKFRKYPFEGRCVINIYYHRYNL